MAAWTKKKEAERAGTYSPTHPTGLITVSVFVSLFRVGVNEESKQAQMKAQSWQNSAVTQEQPIYQAHISPSGNYSTPFNYATQPMVAAAPISVAPPHPLLSSFSSFPGQNAAVHPAAALPHAASMPQAAVLMPAMSYAPPPAQKPPASKLPAWLRDEIRKAKAGDTKPANVIPPQQRVGYQGFNTIAEQMIAAPSPSASPEPEDSTPTDDGDDDAGLEDEEEANLRQEIIVCVDVNG